MSRERGYYSVPKSEVAEVRNTVEGLLRDLASARKSRRWTQEQLAEKLELSIELIRALEQGRRVPSLPTLIRIASTLGLRVTVK